MAGVGVTKHRGKWVDKTGTMLPKDNYSNVRKVYKKDNDGKDVLVEGTIRIDNPDVAKDNRSGSFVFGFISKIAAKRRTNKRHKAKLSN